jgi:redox-sensing transcriptional repressor
LTSRKTIARMSLYRRLLISLRDAGTTHVYSHQLARLAEVTAAQVRRDFMAIGYSGSPTRGYEIEQCIESIGTFLDAPDRQSVALVGVGKLGRSVLAHFAGRRPKLAIVACFDDDLTKVGTSIEGCRCHHVDDLESVIGKRAIEIAIIAVPAEAAQAVADRLVRGGVRSIVSFASTPLHVPPGVTVEDMDITAALETAAYFARLTPAPPETPAAETAVATPQPLLEQLEGMLAASHLKPADVAQRIGARIVTAHAGTKREIARIYAGDRVSDLLDQASDKTLLVTNLMSLQLLRLAELMDVPAVCFVNGVAPEPAVITKADATGTTLMVSPIGVFETCGMIYQSLEQHPAQNGAPAQERA